MKVFESKSFEDFIKRIESKDLEVSTEIYSKISNGFKRNYKKVKVFTVSLNNGEEFDFEIARNEWPKALNTCMDTFADNDMFEECIKIKNILEQLKQ